MSEPLGQSEAWIRALAAVGRQYGEALNADIMRLLKLAASPKPPVGADDEHTPRGRTA